MSQVNTIFEDIFPTSFLLHNNQLTTAQGVLLVELEGLNVKYEILNKAGAYPLTLQYAKTWNNIPTTPSYFSNCNNANIAGISIPKKFLSGDFNGDGKTDIFHLKQGKIFVYMLDAQNNLKLLCTQNDSRINLAYQSLFGDYNGEGKTDLMFPMGNPSVLFATCMLTGVAFNIIERNMVFSTTTTNNWTPQTGVLSTSNLVANDIDGDGKTDILKYFTTTQNGQSMGKLSIYIYHNMGMSLDIRTIFFKWCIYT